VASGPARCAGRPRHGPAPSVRAPQSVSVERLARRRRCGLRTAPRSNTMRAQPSSCVKGRLRRGSPCARSGQQTDACDGGRRTSGSSTTVRQPCCARGSGLVASVRPVRRAEQYANALSDRALSAARRRRITGHRIALLVKRGLRRDASERSRAPLGEERQGNGLPPPQIPASRQPEPAARSDAHPRAEALGTNSVQASDAVSSRMQISILDGRLSRRPGWHAEDLVCRA